MDLGYLINGNALMSEYRITVDKLDFIKHFEESKEKLTAFLNSILHNGPVKMRIHLDISMEKALPPHETLETTFRSKVQLVHQHEIEAIIDFKFQKIVATIEKFSENGSGYRVKELKNVRVLIAKLTT